MNCACTGIRYCGLCEDLDETKKRIEKFKRPITRADSVTREFYDVERPQLDGITIVENFITTDEEAALIERMDSGKPNIIVHRLIIH